MRSKHENKPENEWKNSLNMQKMLLNCENCPKITKYPEIVEKRKGRYE